MSRVRKALGLVLSLVLTTVIALLALFVTRDVILWPVLSAEAPALLGDALGIPIQLGAIEGDAVRQLGLRDVSLAPGADLPGLPEVEGMDLDLAFDAGRLLAGDPTGLRGARAHARRVAIQLGAAPAATSTDDVPIDPWGFAGIIPRFWGILPNGATIEVDDLSIRTADGALLGAGAARMRLTPRPRRRVLVTWSDAVSLELLLTPDGMFHLEAAVADPMQRLRALGVEVPLDGGRLTVSADGDAAARDLDGSLRWTGADLRDRGTSSLRAQVRIRGGFAQADATADLPGIVLQAHDLGIALADLRTALEAARGSLDAAVTDLEPWRPLLPDPVLDWLPITAEVRASLDAEGLDVRRSAVRARGLEVTIDRGRLPVRIDGDLRQTRGSIEARVTAPEPVQIAVAGTELRFAGDAVFGVEGTLDAPSIRARIAMRAIQALGHAADELAATVRIEGNAIEIDEASLRGARPIEVPRGLDAELRGTIRTEATSTAVRTRLEATGAWPELLAHFVPEMAHVSASIDGGTLQVDADLEMPAGPRAVPLGRVDARWTGSDTAPTRIHARAGTRQGVRGIELSVACDGDAAPDLLAALAPGTPLALLPEPVSYQAMGACVLVDRTPRDMTWIADLAGADPVDAQPWQIGVAASSPDATRIDIHHLSICGPVIASARGTVPLTVDVGSIDLALDVDLADTQRLAPWLETTVPALRVHLAGNVRGTLDRPSAVLALDATAEDLRTFLADPGAVTHELPAALRARFRAEDGAVIVDDLALSAGEGEDSATLALRGRAPVRIGSEGISPGRGLITGSLDARSRQIAGTPISVSVPIRWDERAVWVPELELRTPLSKIEGQARVAEPARLLEGSHLGDLVVEGSLELWQLDVMRLPEAIRPAPVLGGVVDAVLSLDGTLGAPAIAGIVTVAAGRAKVANDVPTLDGIEAQFDLSKDLIEISRLTASVGSGSVEAQGTITAGDATSLLVAWEKASIDVMLRAREAVLLRGTGKSLRADSDITLQGDLERLDVTGEVTILSGTIINRISLVPDFATRGGASVGTGLRLFEIPPPLGDALRFDIAVRTEEPLDIVTHVFNAPMSASFSLQGSGAAPFLNGAVSTTRGVLRLPAMSLDVRQALITFVPEEPTRPRILVRADTRRHGVDVSLTATGPADAPELLLSSLPPLTQQELFVLISTGVLPDTLQRQGLAGRASAVGSYLAEEIINFYFGSESTEAGTSLADRIHVYSGREISRKGVESIVVDVDVWNGFALEGERDIYQDFNMGVLYRVRF